MTSFGDILSQWENIQHAKRNIAEGAAEAAGELGTSTSTLSGQSVNVKATAEKIKKHLNYMRKISMDQYEEQYSAELCIKGYTHYKYTKTLREICEWVETLLADYGIKITPDEIILGATIDGGCGQTPYFAEFGSTNCNETFMSLENPLNNFIITLIGEFLDSI